MKSTAQVLFNVKNYFIEDVENNRRKNLESPVLRAVEATGVDRKIIFQLKSQLDVDEKGRMMIIQSRESSYSGSAWMVERRARYHTGYVFGQDRAYYQAYLWKAN